MPPIFSKMQENWSNVGHAAREMVTVFSVTFFLVTVVAQIGEIKECNKCNRLLFSSSFNVFLHRYSIESPKVFLVHPISQVGFNSFQA